MQSLFSTHSIPNVFKHLNVRLLLNGVIFENVKTFFTHSISFHIFLNTFCSYLNANIASQIVSALLVLETRVLELFGELTVAKLMIVVFLFWTITPWVNTLQSVGTVWILIAKLVFISLARHRFVSVSRRITFQAAWMTIGRLVTITVLSFDWYQIAFVRYRIITLMFMLAIAFAILNLKKKQENHLYKNKFNKYILKNRERKISNQCKAWNWHNRHPESKCHRDPVCTTRVHMWLSKPIRRDTRHVIRRAHQIFEVECNRF